MADEASDIEKLKNDLAEAKDNLQRHQEQLKSDERRKVPKFQIDATEDLILEDNNEIAALEKELSDAGVNHSKILSSSEQKEKDDKKEARKEKVKDVAGKVGSKAKNFVTTASSMAAAKLETSGNPHLGAFLLLTLLVHFFDALYNNFSRIGGSFQLMIFLYLFLSLFAIFVIYKSGLSSQTWTILAVSLVAFFSPYILKFNFFDTKIVLAVLIAAPIWALYLFTNPEGSPEIEKWGRRYFYVFIFFCAYAVISNMSVGPQLSFSGADSANGLAVLKEFFVDNTEKMVKSIINIPDTINRKLNNTPGMEYFTGQVEDDEGAPLGVYIEDLKPIEPIFDKNRPVIVLGVIRGRSFSDAIEVKNSCYTTKDKNIIHGKVSPENVSLYFDEVIPLQCEFVDKLSAGNYKVIILSKFKFPTQGDITYTYMSRDDITSFYTQKININQELNIPPFAVATYTNGPAAIGIRSLPLPIGVDIPKIAGPPSAQVTASLPNFGVTLSNQWSQGKIETVEKMDVITPTGIKLKDCYPEEIESNQSDGTKKYSFSIIAPGTDKINSFTTITCKSEVEDLSTFLGLTGFVDKTFVVHAVYRYSLEKSTSVRVK